MKKKNLWIALAVAVLIAGGIGYYLTRQEAAGPGASAPGAPAGSARRGGFGEGRPMPVTAVAAKRGEIDVVLSAIGTVTAKNTAIVKPRVDGQLVRVLFREGQMVKAGDVLAEIDARPYQVLLDQANGQLARDQAQLTNAVVDLQRYQILMAKDSIARQQVDAQEALVRQYQGAVQVDRAQVDSAKLQLSFTRITAPTAGRLGLRQVDVGNMVRASDTNGLVVITQTQPISTVFSIPADNLAAVASRVQAGEALQVEAHGREGKARLAVGKVTTIDNQIDVTTGTVKVKAEFDNADNALFPNQFVNVRLRVETRKDAILVPVAAVQRGSQGTFVYVANAAEKNVALRPVVLGPANAEFVAIEKGVAVDELVVTDGADKLRQGARIELIGNAPKPGGPKAATPEAGAAASAAAPPWLDRLPPDVREKVMKMSPEERQAWIQKRREERAKQGGGAG